MYNYWFTADHSWLALSQPLGLRPERLCRVHESTATQTRATKTHAGKGHPATTGHHTEESLSDPCCIWFTYVYMYSTMTFLHLDDFCRQALIRSAHFQQCLLRYFGEKYFPEILYFVNLDVKCECCGECMWKYCQIYLYLFIHVCSLLGGGVRYIDTLYIYRRFMPICIFIIM